MRRKPEQKYESRQMKNGDSAMKSGSVGKNLIEHCLRKDFKLKSRIKREEKTANDFSVLQMSVS